MHLDPTDQDACFADGTNPNARADAMLDLLVPIASNLPEIVDMVVSTHDLGSWIIGDDQRIFLENKIANREYATAEELKPFENANRHKAKGLPGFAVSIVLCYFSDSSRVHARRTVPPGYSSSSSLRSIRARKRVLGLYMSRPRKIVSRLVLLVLTSRIHFHLRPLCHL